MDTKIKTKFLKMKAVLLLILAGALSIVLAMAGVNYGAVELGALIYLIIPIFVTVLAIVLFFILTLITSINSKLLAIILSVVILLIGLFLRLDFYYSFIDF